MVYLSSLWLLAGVCLGQSRPAVPVRIPLAAATQMSEATPDIESPGLYDLVRQVAGLPLPGQSQGIPYDRSVLLGQPEAFVGDLITTSARHVETTQVRLENAPEDTPGLVWSTLAVDADRAPVQILTLGHRPNLARLDRIRCVGYFYKIRLDQAAAPDKTGTVAAIQVPVLVGWILPDVPMPLKPGWAIPVWQILGASVAAALVLFFAMMLFARRRVDWRTRLAEQRRKRTNRPDKTNGL
jgi:hypothetical protein